ncbi:hypothetical protein KGQ72_02815 [Patescibacteria group bacterium]|nr:hypothetical protein [Patescibacteria group bacterium]
MPQRKNNQGPPPVMTWRKASWVLALALIFDALRIVFEQFWFFGPALAALFCTIKVGDVVGTTIGGLACGAVSVAAGVAAAAAVETFGVVMAMAVGFAGWLVVGLIIIKTNGRILKENAGHALWFVGSLLVSEIPIVGTFPALTGVVVKMYATQIKKDRETLKKYQEQQQAEQVEEQYAAEFMQVQAAELAESEVY